MKQIHNVAKVVGTVITVTGAMVMTLYKGPIVDMLFSEGGGGGSHHKHSSSSSGQHWTTGTIMLLSCVCGWSCFFILQSITLKEYPAELSLTALICLFGMVEGGAVALVMERDMSAWVVGFDFRLLAAVYSGIVCSGIAYYLQSMVNKARGPVFVTAFSPLSMIITAILGALFLSEQVHLGSLIGAIVIVIGLYSVVWGKSKDQPSSMNSITSENGQSNELPVVNTTKSCVKVGGDGIDGPVKSCLPQEP
ncbi:unnamed protein product [Ilex paraguariensis]|uniref:WAT1-related protein n=1 Tax=Ilex paraguariensis TaxID=185542 RepID=A0ABC8STV2_9AQUA